MDFDQNEESCTCIIYRKDRKHPIKVTEYMSICWTVDAGSAMPCRPRWRDASRGSGAGRLALCSARTARSSGFLLAH
jgi:hypothetical protein